MLRMRTNVPLSADTLVREGRVRRGGSKFAASSVCCAAVVLVFFAASCAGAGFRPHMQASNYTSGKKNELRIIGGSKVAVSSLFPAHLLAQMWSCPLPVLRCPHTAHPR